MAHPFHHAISSVKQFGGQIDDYLRIHQYIDNTKTITSDFRHRALRHKIEILPEIIRFFGKQPKIEDDLESHTIINSDNNIVPIENIVKQHLVEDSGFIVAEKDWVDSFILNERHSKISEVQLIQWRKGCKAYKVSVNDADIIFNRVIGCPEKLIVNKAAYFKYAHSFGIFQYELDYGVQEINIKVPNRMLVEKLLMVVLRHIPETAMTLKNISVKDWMHKPH